MPDNIQNKPNCFRLKGPLIFVGLGLVLLLSVFLYSQRNSLRTDYLHYKLENLKKEIASRELHGEFNQPARQILMETQWILSKTHDQARTAQRIDALETAMHDPIMRTAVDSQSEIDGSWGRWYTEWFYKLDATYDAIQVLESQGRDPAYVPHLLDRVNSPEKLTAHLNQLLVSDKRVADHRKELNETVSDLTRLILRNMPHNYAWDPAVKPALLDWLYHTARNPETGYWGAWYQEHGSVRKTDDLSVTFHVVSYLKGDVPDWPKIIDTTLAIKDREYPLGWLGPDGYMNHHNMDVVELFRLGWTHATPAQQDTMRTEIQKMLTWCLTHSLRADGSFFQQPDDDSLEEAIYCGAEFLRRIGYFDPSKRFWTDQTFPDAEKNRQTIAKFIRAHMSYSYQGGAYYRSALERID